MGGLKRLLSVLASRRGGPRPAAGSLAEVMRLCGEQRFDAALAHCRQWQQAQPQVPDAWFACGNVLRLLGRGQEAEPEYRRCLALQPTHHTARASLGAILSASGAHEEALAVFEEGLALTPDVADFWQGASVCLLHLGRLDDALRLLAASRVCGEHPFQYEHEAAVRQRQQNPAAALACLCAGCERFPSSVPLLRAAGQQSMHLGQYREAAAYYERALRLLPADAGLHCLLGELYRAQSDWEQALDCYRTALHYAADDPRAHAGIALIYRHIGQLPLSRQHMETAATLAAGSATIWQDLGVIAMDGEDYERAVACFRRVLELQPGNVRAMSNLGFCLLPRHGLDEHPESSGMRLLADALTLDPAYHPARVNYCVALMDAGLLQQAQERLEQLVSEYPADPKTRWHLALCHLLQGRFDLAWPYYAARKQLKDFTVSSFPYPAWQGEELAGRLVLVVAEQGLGDQIMFASCIPDLIRCGAQCVIECAKRLAPLFQRSFPQARVHADGMFLADNRWPESYGRVDYQVAMGDLPGFFRNTLSSFPMHRGYLRADPARVAYWRERLERLGNGPRIGLSWRGGTQRSRGRVRSIAPKQLASWLQGMPDCQWVSLQYGEVAADLDEITRISGRALEHWPEAIEDYSETAALVCALDGVVTVQTAVAHLAGALGRPAAVMIPFSPEWRYLQQGSTIPWYPSLTLLRQPRPGDWQAVLSQAQRWVKNGLYLSQE